MTELVRRGNVSQHTIFMIGLSLLDAQSVYVLATAERVSDGVALAAKCEASRREWGAAPICGVLLKLLQELGRLPERVWRGCQLCPIRVWVWPATGNPRNVTLCIGRTWQPVCLS